MAANLPEGHQQPPDHTGSCYTDSSSNLISDPSCRNTSSTSISDPAYRDASSVPISDPANRDASSVSLTDPDYRDASSLATSDPDIKDTSCLPVSANNPESDGDNSPSSGSCYMDAVQTESMMQQDSSEAPYIDAVSTGSILCDTQEWQQSAGWSCGLLITKVLVGMPEAQNLKSQEWQLKILVSYVVY